MYIHYLYPFWDYFGFDYNVPRKGYLVLAWILSVAPSFWMPIRLTRPSQLAYWVLYMVVIIPSMFVPLYAGLDSPGDIARLMLTLFASFAIAGASYISPLIDFRPREISPKKFWKWFGFLAAGLSLWILIVFRHQAHIASFLEIYDVRNAANDVADEGSLVNYAFMLLTGAINPFLMGYGLWRRRPWIFLGGVVGQILVYSIGGTKGSILSILFIAGFYFLLRLKTIAFGNALAWSFVILLAGTCLSYVLANYQPGPLHTLALFVILMRTLSTGGLLTAQYHNFFLHNPFTYYSHLKIFNLFVHYPYQYPVGQEIGLAFAGTTNLDATANFWATDGMESMGLPGILLISVFCALVFWLLDSLARRHDPRLIALIITYAAYNIANISIFTSLLSGGLALLMLVVYVMPVELEAANEARNSAETPIALSVPAMAGE